MKSITKRRKRVSFIPELIRTPLNFYAEDSLDSQDTRHMVDVEVWPPITACLVVLPNTHVLCKKSDIVKSVPRYLPAMPL